MIVKTSELTGAALDRAVAKCKYVSVRDGFDDDCPEYSTNWSQGGPIIEREGFTTAVHTTENGVITSWKAGRDWPMSHFPFYIGPTPLIAAMRAYVASKLGKEVEVPEKLL